MPVDACLVAARSGSAEVVVDAGLCRLLPLAPHFAVRINVYRRCASSRYRRRLALREIRSARSWRARSQYRACGMHRSVIGQETSGASLGPLHQ